MRGSFVKRTLCERIFCKEDTFLKDLLLRGNFVRGSFVTRTLCERIFCIEEGFVKKPRQTVVVAFWGKMATHMLL